ncbi:hypothetical protein [Rubellicoccus peritrichatus]|uniref:Outer membrane lipoprotein carrier protein LolA n=1 Tax=Rubellicoccus peritrichatus TaxID=3080537 RepID=A0AAQ3L9X0_9BACT|nr:hypothetical protein [Puniceicoccus sp. CR14]WOO42329.1 hypothetical protein RZN69_04450 [Puniceicoccus sp. CR14]
MIVFIALVASACESYAAATELGPEALKETLDKLAPPQSEHGFTIPFKEARSFPFRRYPKNFEGKVYAAADGQLAIVYSFPSSYRIIISGDQIELIYDDGETRDLSGEAGLHVFTDLLKWDTEAISQNWPTSSVNEQDGRYYVTLVPIDSTLAKSIKELSFQFDDQRVFSVSIKQRDGVGRKYEFGPAVPMDLGDPEIREVFSR